MVIISDFRKEETLTEDNIKTWLGPFIKENGGELVWSHYNIMRAPYSIKLMIKTEQESRLVSFAESTGYNVLSSHVAPNGQSIVIELEAKEVLTI